MHTRQSENDNTSTVATLQHAYRYLQLTECRLLGAQVCTACADKREPNVTTVVHHITNYY